jgi:large subunit ribosomal protein L30
MEKQKKQAKQAFGKTLTKTKQEEKQKPELVAVIRISGMVKIKKVIENTLYRLRLRRKYACVLINGNNEDLMGMLEKVKFYVAYGPVDKETLVKLIKERAEIDKTKKENKEMKINPEKTAEKLLEGKTLKELGLKSFFRLHPPRKGIKSKLQFPKGVLGNNSSEINKLIERML